MLTRNLRTLLPIATLAAVATLTFAQSAPTTVTFSSQSFNTGPGPIAIVTGDFNEDGKPDLAVLDAASNAVQIVLNNGNGTFRLGSQFATGMNPVAIVAGNVNNDGHQDLVVANSDRTLTIATGAGDGTFPSPSSFPTTGVPAAMVGANLINNGLTQLATVECASANTAPCTLNIYQSDGHALFSHSFSTSLPTAPLFNNMIVSDDFNLDNKPDVAVGTTNKVLVFRNTSVFNGTGNASVALMTTITPPTTETIDSIATGHLNAGAAPDLVIEGFDQSPDSSPPQSEFTYLNNGNGTFFEKARLVPSTSFGHRLAIGDINGDGIQDLVLIGTSAHNLDLSYALGRGDGTFVATKEVAGFPSGTNTGIAVRDLNLDSRHDLAITSGGPLGGPPFTDVSLNTNATTNCAPPGSASLAVKICAAIPSTNALTVRAAGNSQNGVKRVELWVDSHKVAQNFSDQLNVKVGVAAGTHTVTVVGVDLYDKLVKSTVTVKVP